MNTRYVYEFNLKLNAEQDVEESEVLQPTQTHTIDNFQIIYKSSNQFDV